jgi:hypothetical protein
MTEMSIEEARAILAAQDTTDTARSLLAVSVWARFHGIAAPRLLAVAEDIEAVAESLRKGDQPMDVR